MTSIEFAGSFRTIREQRGISIEDAAGLLGVTAGLIRAWERGKRLPHLAGATLEVLDVMPKSKPNQHALCDKLDSDGRALYQLWNIIVLLEAERQAALDRAGSIRSTAGPDDPARWYAPLRRIEQAAAEVELLVRQRAERAQSDHDEDVMLTMDTGGYVTAST